MAAPLRAASRHPDTLHREPRPGSRWVLGVEGVLRGSTPAAYDLPGQVFLTRPGQARPPLLGVGPAALTEPGSPTPGGLDLRPIDP